MFEKKYKLLFMRKEYSTMYLVGMIKTNEIGKSIRFNNRTFEVKIELPCFSEQKTKIYIFDYDLGIQMKFDEIKAVLNPEETDLFMAQHLISELTAGIIADKKQKIIDMIMGAIIGGLLAALAMFMYMNNKIEEIYATFTPSVVLP